MKIRHMDKEYLQFLVRSKQNLVAFAKALGYTKRDCLAAYMMLKMIRIEPRRFVPHYDEDQGADQMKALLAYMKGLKYDPDEPDDMPGDAGETIGSNLDL